METKANTMLIGAFTLAVLALFGLFGWWYLRGGDSDRVPYRVLFSGSVGGLRTGANVFFNGIRVGEVRAIRVDAADPRRVVADINVAAATPVRTNTRAVLEVQILSGIASIALMAGEGPGAPLPPGPDGGPPMLVAEPSGLGDVMQTARQILANVDGLVRRVDDVIATSRGSVERTLANVESFSRALSDNSEAVGTFLRETGEAGRQIAALAQRLDRVAGQVESLMEGAQPGRVTSILNNIDDLTRGLAAQRDNFADLIREARGAAGALTRTLGSIDEVATTFDVRALNRTLTEANRVIAALDSERINRALGNIDRFTQTLGDNSANVDQIVRNATEVAAKLNGLADRVDQLLRGLSGDGTNSMFAEFANTAKAVRTLAERLDTRTAQLTNSISGFTDRTIRDIQSLSADGRRTLAELERTLRSLERNPQRFIFGGSGVPEFNRR